MSLAENVEECTRIDRSRARRHRDTLERREAHRRIHRAARENGGDRGSATEMTDDQTGDRVAQELGDTLCAPLDREALKSVAANAPLLTPDRRYCVLGSFGRDGAMKRRVEDRNVRYMRKDQLRYVNRLECRRVVKGGERDQLAYLVANPVIDHHRIPEAWATVDDPMRNRIDFLGHLSERVDENALLVRLHSVELQTRRAGVDDEDRAHRGVQPVQVQSRISGGSSPCARPYARARRRASTISWRR